MRPELRRTALGRFLARLCHGGRPPEGPLSEVDPSRPRMAGEAHFDPKPTVEGPAKPGGQAVNAGLDWRASQDEGFLEILPA